MVLLENKPNASVFEPPHERQHTIDVLHSGGATPNSNSHHDLESRILDSRVSNTKSSLLSKATVLLESHDLSIRSVPRQAAPAGATSHMRRQSLAGTDPLQPLGIAVDIESQAAAIVSGFPLAGSLRGDP